MQFLAQARLLRLRIDQARQWNEKFSAKTGIHHRLAFGRLVLRAIVNRFRHRQLRDDHFLLGSNVFRRLEDDVEFLVGRDFVLRANVPDFDDQLLPAADDLQYLRDSP